MPLIIVFFLLFFVRYLPVLRTYFKDSLNFVGIMVGTHIYTPVSTIQHTSRHWVDFVLLGKHHNHIHVYSLFYGNYFTIQLHHIPVGHKLVYLHGDKKINPPYMEGTPFTVKDGHLVLYKRKRKRFGFNLEKVKESQTWPM